jgi:hypothetical protein
MCSQSPWRNKEDKASKAISPGANIMFISTDLTKEMVAWRNVS